MEASGQDGLNKRSLEETPGSGLIEVKEKRARLESGISDISDVEASINFTTTTSNVINVALSKENVEGFSVDNVEEEAEVIYELSSDNNGSPCK